jgi:hypothetical protein
VPSKISKMSSGDIVTEQFANVIETVCAAFAHGRYTDTIAKKRRMRHDVPRAMHYAILLAGRRSVGNAVTNAINIRDSFRGPNWSQAQDDHSDRSVHAEARAAFRAAPKNLHSKRARRKAMRQSVGAADGVLVCRVNRGGRLCYSMPCSKCVEVLARGGFRFVVFSTGDEARPWCKISLSRLLIDDRVQPVRALRK